MISGASVVVGCGGDTGGGGGAGGGAGGGTASSSSTGSPTTTSSSASSSSGGAAVAATIASYCKDITANCTGDNAQYANDANCQAIAKSYAQGTIGAMDGNSLECRTYHAGAAKSLMKPEVHCAHAGLTGGDLDPTTEGVDEHCGNGVEAFCKLAVDTCKGQPGAYADVAACTAEAKTFTKSTTPFSATKDTAGNTFNCRAYHLTAAVTDPVKHCPHIKLDSATCK